MTGICGHIPGTTCTNCASQTGSTTSWSPWSPNAFDRIANALEKMIDAYTQAQRRDHYALNDRCTENKATLDLIECLREIERTRPGSNDQPTSEQFQEGLTLAYDWLRSALRDHGVGVSSRPKPDPLDEDDHRDRVCKDGDGERLVRSFRGHWHTPDFDCRKLCRSVTDDLAFTLAVWNADCGPLTFAPDAVQEYAGPNPLDENDHRDRLDAEGGPCYRNPGGCWHTSKRDCTGCVWTLARLSKHYGPLTFAPDTSPSPQDAEPDPLDEDDHRDRIEKNGERLVRSFRGHWHTPDFDCRRYCRPMTDDATAYTLAAWNKDCGPLTFAPDAVQEYAVNDVRQQEAQMEDAWQSRDWDSVSRLQDEAQQREEAVIDYEDIREGMTIEAAYSNGTRFRFVATRGYAYWSDPSGCFRIMPPGTEGLDPERVIRLIAPPATAIDNTPPFDQED